MKTNLTFALLSAGFLTASFAGEMPEGLSESQQQAWVENKPWGELTSNNDRVYAGTHANLNWEVNYPTKITINPDDSVTASDETCFEVRILGCAIGNSNNGWPVQVQIDNGGGWTEFFFGNNREVEEYTSTVRSSGTLPADVKLNFRARTNKNGSMRGNSGNYRLTNDWMTWRSTTDTVNTLIALKNGDDVPGIRGRNGQEDAEYFLRPYIVEDSSGNGKISIGPKDVIYLFELHSEEIDNTADMQDMVVLVSFDTCETNNVADGNPNPPAGNGNNGHGNNADGVDVSNPGQGGGGPNGADDTDYDGDGIYEDDENK